jgi:hypothetical protein
MNELWKNLISELEMLKTDSEFSYHGNTGKVKDLLFEYFCGLNTQKYFSDESELAKLKDLIAEKSEAFGYVFARLETSFSFEGFDEWGKFCKIRSVLQFIVDLFQNDIERLFPNIQKGDFDEFDQRMMDMAYMEGCYPPEKVPEGVPYSHWWWSRLGPGE